MITPRIRRRRRVLDAYVRVELEERRLVRDDRAHDSLLEPGRPRLKVLEEDLRSGEDAREDRSA